MNQKRLSKRTIVLLVLDISILIVHNVNMFAFHWTGLLFVTSLLAAVLTAVTMIVFIRDRKVSKIERIKSVCFALLAIWWVFPGLFLLYSPVWEKPEMLYWYSSWPFFVVIITLAAVYLIGARKKENNKYSMILCICLAVFCLLFWNVSIT